ncbi:hypothetical protein ACRAWD_27165 [Caulobacter segnis]
MYLDDVRLTYNAPDPDLLLVDIGQVEVLRGPQGALYGAGSLGRSPATDDASPRSRGFRRLGFALRLDDARAVKAGGLASAMINMPLLRGRAAVRLVGYAEHQGEPCRADPGQGAANVNSTRRAGVRLSALSQPDAGWTAETGVTGQWINSKDTQYADRDVGEPTAP